MVFSYYDMFNYLHFDIFHPLYVYIFFFLITYVLFYLNVCTMAPTMAVILVLVGGIPVHIIWSASTSNVFVYLFFLLFICILYGKMKSTESEPEPFRSRKVCLQFY